MIFLNMPIVIVGAFLLLTLVVGIYFSRKKTTFREYAVGNKNFSTATLIATVLATTYSGGVIIRNVECYYSYGLYWIILAMLNFFGFWIFGKFVLRMGPFMHHLSSAETIGSIYGRYPRLVTSLIGICQSIVSVTTQIIVMSHAFTMCFGSINSFFITISSTLILIFYSMFGGVRAVTYTDVFQFITFSIIIPFLCWFMFLKVNKPVSEIFSMIQIDTRFQFSNLFRSNNQLISMFLLLLAAIVPYMGPGLMQRVYMSSGPIQAKKVFTYSVIFHFIIKSFIILVALFVFAGSPHLDKESVWRYIMENIPTTFKGFFAVGLLAMAMSTADSFLNASSVIVSNDIVKGIINNGKEIYDRPLLMIARWTTLVVGFFAMFIASYCKDLLKLLYWSLDCSVPIIVAPFILAIFGFRGTSRTALIGMITGLLAILAWNKWINPSTGMNGSFLAMLANGLAMMAAHYLLKQPEDTGWVKPDNTFRQIQQEDSRKRSERKEAIKNAWENRKITLSNLIPSHIIIVSVGVYTTISNLMAYFLGCITNHGYWLIFQLFLSASLIGYPFFYDISKKVKSIPRWFIGLYWLMFLAVYMPSNLFLYWFNIENPIFSLSFFLSHCTIILWILPLYLGMGIVGTTLLASIYPIITKLSFSELSYLFPLFIVSLLMFVMTIIVKVGQGRYIIQNIYLKNQEKIRASQKLKASLYEAALVPSHSSIPPERYNSILEQAIHKVEESVSFLGKETPVLKEDLQSIFNKLYEWVAYFTKRAKAKEHALLHPTKITLDNLIRKVEVALSQEVDDPPKILVEKVRPSNKELSPDIVCDIHQVVYSLAKSVLRVGKLDEINPPIVNIALYPTSLQFKQAGSIDDACPIFMDFSATALLISESTTFSEKPLKIKECYNEIDFIDLKVNKDRPPSIDLEQDTIASMTRAHYGYFKVSTDKDRPFMLIVLPNDVGEIRNKMTYELPTDALTIETPVTPKEQADSMMELMQFHDHVCKSLCKEDPIDPSIISGLLLLLREHFGFKRHASGKLFYVRAVGIAKLVVDWVFHSPKVIYASLLYGLVRRTCLPLSYIKQHYNLGVYAFVSNVVKIDKREALDDPSLLCVKNRLEQAIQEEHVQLSVLFIKLAERLYDLRQAESYIYLTEVKHMAQETLAIDIQIANAYLGSEIAQTLEEAAKQALEVCKNREKDKNS